MQPQKSSRSSTEAVSWKMCVPATLQPDVAWKRPAHTGPSLVEAPVGLQSPYCTRPPRWVQKQERRARRHRAPIRLVPARTASTYGGPDQVRGGQKSSFITEGILTLPPSKPFQPKTSRLTTSNRKIDFREESEVVLGEERVKKKRRNRKTNKQNSLQGKMESIFQLGSAFSHACSGLNSYTNRARQHLSKGRTHSSAH